MLLWFGAFWNLCGEFPKIMGPFFNKDYSILGSILRKTGSVQDVGLGFWDFRLRI